MMKDFPICRKIHIGNNVQEIIMLTNGSSLQVDALGRPCL
jgi:hypothetical protein